jgi:hypothetical protein
MAFIIEGRTFTPAPEGCWDAVLVDLTPKKLVDTPWGKKQVFFLVWELSCKRDDGKPFIVRQRYTPSLDSKSNLRKHLVTWRGRDFTSDEIRRFDLEKVLGAPCQLVVTHTEKEGTMYANVQAVLKAGPNKLKPSGSYIRVQDREDFDPSEYAPTKQEAGSPAANQQPPKMGKCELCQKEIPADHKICEACSETVPF